MFNLSTHPNTYKQVTSNISIKIHNTKANFNKSL